MDQNERLHKGTELLRKLQNDLIDLEVMLEMEKVGAPADSGFAEAMEDVRENWSKFNELFGEDS